MDDLAALRLQLEWGADEAIMDEPTSRLDRISPHAPTLLPRPAPAPVPAPTPLQAAPRATPTAIAALPSLAALHAALDALDHPLRPTAGATVAPSGNPAAGLVLLAQAPGREDDRTGQAFSGEPGQKLDAVLASAGLTRHHLLLTHLVPWRPPGGREPNPAEIAACLPYLHRLLALTRARHLILCGSHPTRALAGSSLRQLRGRWTELHIPGLDTPLQALAMLPPDQWRTTPTARRNTWSDLLTLREALDGV